MKYANRLTDEELREVYCLFIDSGGRREDTKCLKQY